MNFILMAVVLGISFPQENYFVYQDSTPENIEYCANIIHNPTMTQQFEEQCSIDKTLAYMSSIKN